MRDLRRGGAAIVMVLPAAAHAPQGPLAPADARVRWRLTDRLEMPLNGPSLIEQRRLETGDRVRERALGRSVRRAVRASF